MDKKDKYSSSTNLKRQPLIDKTNVKQSKNRDVATKISNLNHKNNACFKTIEEGNRKSPRLNKTPTLESLTGIVTKKSARKALAKVDEMLENPTGIVTKKKSLAKINKEILKTQVERMITPSSKNISKFRKEFKSTPLKPVLNPLAVYEFEYDPKKEPKRKVKKRGRPKINLEESVDTSGEENNSFKPIVKALRKKLDRKVKSQNNTNKENKNIKVTENLTNQNNKIQEKSPEIQCDSILNTSQQNTNIQVQEEDSFNKKRNVIKGSSSRINIISKNVSVRKLFKTDKKLESAKTLEPLPIINTPQDDSNIQVQEELNEIIHSFSENEDNNAIINSPSRNNIISKNVSVRKPFKSDMKLKSTKMLEPLPIINTPQDDSNKQVEEELNEIIHSFSENEDNNAIINSPSRMNILSRNVSVRKPFKPDKKLESTKTLETLPQEDSNEIIHSFCENEDSNAIISSPSRIDIISNLISRKPFKPDTRIFNSTMLQNSGFMPSPWRLNISGIRKVPQNFSVKDKSFTPAYDSIIETINRETTVNASKKTTRNFAKNNDTNFTSKEKHQTSILNFVSSSKTKNDENSQGGLFQDVAAKKSSRKILGALNFNQSPNSSFNSIVGPKQHERNMSIVSPKKKSSIDNIFDFTLSPSNENDDVNKENIPRTRSKRKKQTQAIIHNAPTRISIKEIQKVLVNDKIVEPEDVTKQIQPALEPAVESVQKSETSFPVVENNEQSSIGDESVGLFEDLLQLTPKRNQKRFTRQYARKYPKRKRCLSVESVHSEDESDVEVSPSHNLKKKQRNELTVAEVEETEKLASKINSMFEEIENYDLCIE